MTPEEAIEVLKNTAWLGTDNGIKVYPAISIAVDALEKQVPISPVSIHERNRIFKGNGEFDIEVNEWFECPNCGECVPIEKQGFCYACGQRINWNEVE